MLGKRSLIVILVGLNLFLLALLLVGTYSLPAAYAQGGARPGDFACVTAKSAGQSYEVLYVLDVPTDKLYAFYPASGAANQLTAAPPRDLAADFSR
jgi:hypothetical protein